MQKTKSTEYDHKLIFDFLGYLDLELNVADNTISAYRKDVHDFQDYLHKQTDLSIVQVRDVDFLDYLVHLRRKGISPRSSARKISAIKHLYRFLSGERHIKNDPTLVLDSPTLLRALPEVMNKQDVAQLIEAASGVDPLSLRDRAILELWYACGLRISEVGSLRIGDVHEEIGVIRVHGKGDKERLVPFGKYARKALQAYLGEARATMVKGNSQDFLFLSRKGGRLSRMGLWEIFAKYVKKIGYIKPVTPHILRHSCATHMVEGGADIRTVMEFLGHADITTTQIYTHLDQKYLKEVHQKCHPREKADERKHDLQLVPAHSSTGKKAGEGAV